MRWSRANEISARSGVLAGRAGFQKLPEQEREQPRAQIFRDGQILAAVLRQFERALGQENGSHWTAGQTFGKTEQRQVINLQEIFDSGEFAFSHRR
jgi:hypothetical protein